MSGDPSWDNLQEPARPSSFPPAYLLLLAAIDTGWSISEPVLAQADLPDRAQCSYSFVLTNGNPTASRQLIVPQCHPVDVFIRSEGLAVIDNMYA